MGGTEVKTGRDTIGRGDKGQRRSRTRRQRVVGAMVDSRRSRGYEKQSMVEGL